MALIFYGMFDSVSGDVRTYAADSMASFFRALATDGVADLEDCLKVVPDGSSMKTRVGYGSAMLQGYLLRMTDDGGAPCTLTHSASGPSPRIDRVVARLNLDTGARTIILAVLQGTPAASPVAPALTRTALVWEISLAQVLIPASATSIVAGNITDERGDEAVCGAITPHALRPSILGGTHRHDLVTAIADGYMAKTDKAKLDAINQSLSTTSTPTFAGINVNGPIGGITVFE